MFAHFFPGAAADGTVPGAVKDVNGKYYDREEYPTFKVKRDGTVDWYTFSGYLRYSSTCVVCHGPDGAGSAFAPALSDS